MRNLLLLGLAGVGAYCLYKGYLKKETKDVLGAAKEGAQDLVNVVLPENTSAASGGGERYAIDGNRVFCNCPGGGAMIDCTDYKSAYGAPNCDKCRRKHGGCNEGGVANPGKGGFGFKRRMAVRPSNGHPMFG